MNQGDKLALIAMLMDDFTRRQNTYLDQQNQPAVNLIQMLRQQLNIMQSGNRVLREELEIARGIHHQEEINHDFTIMMMEHFEQEYNKMCNVNRALRRRLGLRVMPDWYYDIHGGLPINIPESEEETDDSEMTEDMDEE